MNPPSLLDPEFLAKLEHCSRIAKKILAGERAIDGWMRAAPGSKPVGTRFQEHRSYSPGDDPRRVDWNVYGRLGELFVKVFEPEERGEVLVFLDRSASVASGASSRLALELAAAFGFIGCAAFEGASVSPFPRDPGAAGPMRYRGESGGIPLLRALDAMAREKPVESGPGELVQVVQEATSLLRRPAWVLVFSDFYPIEPFERAFAALRRFRVLGVQIFDPHDWDPPEQGLSLFEHPETLRRRKIAVSPKVRQRYQELMRRQFDLVDRVAREQGARMVRISSESSFEAAALAILSQGALSR